MIGFELVEEFLCGSSLPYFCVLKSLTNTFLCDRLGRNIELELISVGILHDGRTPTPYDYQHIGFALSQHLIGQTSSPVGHYF